jgi:hypothetical protein
MTADQPHEEVASITSLSGSLQNRSFTLTKRVSTIGSDVNDDVVVTSDPLLAPGQVRIVRGDAVWRMEQRADAANDTITLNHQPATSGVLREGAPSSGRPGY